MRIESYFGLRGAPVCRLRALFLPAPVGGSPLHFARAKVMYSCCASILCMAHDAATCALGVSSLCSSLLSLAHALSSYVAHSSPLVVPRSPVGQHYDVLAFATNVQPAPNAAAATALASSMHRLHSLSTAHKLVAHRLRGLLSCWHYACGHFYVFGAAVRSLLLLTCVFLLFPYVFRSLEQLRPSVASAHRFMS